MRRREELRRVDSEGNTMGKRGEEKRPEAADN